MVRLGVALYGLQPSTAVPFAACIPSGAELEDTGRQVKDLYRPAHRSADGNTFHTGRETRLAVIPVGYATVSAARRSIGDKCWCAAVGAHRRPRHHGPDDADVTDIPGVRQGDEVVLIGRQGEAELTADQVAERLGTISYEVVSQILARCAVV